MCGLEVSKTLRKDSRDPLGLNLKLSIGGGADLASAMAAASDKDELFMAVLNRWRELGGLVAGGGREGTVVEEGDEATLRHGDWVYLVLGDETEEHLKAFEGGVTRVLDATFGKPGREGIESWG